MRNPAAFFSVVYPQALPYLSELRDSFSAQTRNDFDVIIVNDGCEEQSIADGLKGLNLTILEPDRSIAANRLKGIDYAKSKGYEFILFADADDTFTADRYECTIDEFGRSDADVLACNLNIVDEHLTPLISDYFSKELPLSCMIDKDFIMKKNIFGMSNTAIRLSSIKGEMIMPDTKIVDWYLFSLLILKGYKARYITDSKVNYRQYSNNMIGITRYDSDSFRRLSLLKFNHYCLLLDAGHTQYLKLKRECESLLTLSESEICSIINQQLKVHPQPLWWQIISRNIDN